MNDRVDERELEAPDLSRLPLFQTDAPPASAGRRRSTFSLVRGSASVERIRAAAAPANLRSATPPTTVAESVPDVAVRLTPNPGQVVVWSGGHWDRLLGRSSQIVFVL